MFSNLCIDSCVRSLLNIFTKPKSSTSALDNSPTESLSFNPIYFSNRRRKPFTFFCILSFISITSKTLAIVWKSEISCFLAKAIIRVTVVLPIPLCGKFIILSKLSSSFWLTITRRYAIISFTSFLL